MQTTPPMRGAVKPSHLAGLQSIAPTQIPEHVKAVLLISTQIASRASMSVSELIGDCKVDRKKDRIPCLRPTVWSEDQCHPSISTNTVVLIRIVMPKGHVLGVASRWLRSPERG